MIRPLKLVEFTKAIMDDKCSMSRFCIDMINNLNDPEYKKAADRKVVQMGHGAVDAYRRHPKKSADQDYINGYELMLNKRDEHVQKHKTSRRISDKRGSNGKD